MAVIFLVPVATLLLIVSGITDLFRSFRTSKRGVSDDTTPKKMPTPSPKRDGRKKKANVQVVSEFSTDHELPEFYWSD